MPQAFEVLKGPLRGAWKTSLLCCLGGRLHGAQSYFNPKGL